MKYSIAHLNEKGFNPTILRYGEYCSLANNAELEFWMQIQKLETALTNISTMPEYDQDDAHRLRDIAKRALASQ